MSTCALDERRRAREAWRSEVRAWRAGLRRRLLIERAQSAALICVCAAMLVGWLLLLPG